MGTVVGQWHERTVDLSAYAGKTINQFLVGNSSAAPVGTWNAWYSDIAILSADGTVTPIYTGQTSAGFQFVSTSSPLASNLSASVIHDSTVGANTQLTTSYYHGDQIGSSRLMTSAQGWPIWQGTFLPFGEEYNPQISTNHYKFTGKQRDAESGLDYFGARYYGSALGRFITSDWSVVPAPVPYADWGDPQSLNLFTYVRDIPTQGWIQTATAATGLIQLAILSAERSTHGAATIWPALAGWSKPLPPGKSVSSLAI